MLRLAIAVELRRGCATSMMVGLPMAVTSSLLIFAVIRHLFG